MIYVMIYVVIYVMIYVVMFVMIYVMIYVIIFINFCISTEVKCTEMPAANISRQLRASFRCSCACMK